MVPEERRRRLEAMSEAMAPGWERRRARIDATLEPVRRWMVRELAPARGETVLELAAASGDTGLEAAAIVGGEGRLISTDLTPAMVEIGRRRAAEVGARNVEHRAMDAERIDLPDGSVRRGPVPVRLHADGRPGGRPGRDATGPEARRQGRARGVGAAGAQPVGRHRGPGSRRGRPRPAPVGRRSLALRPRRRRAHGGAPGRRRSRERPRRGGAGDRRLPGRSTTT